MMSCKMTLKFNCRDLVVPGGPTNLGVIPSEKEDSDKDDDVFYDSEDESEDQSDTFA